MNAEQSKRIVFEMGKRVADAVIDIAHGPYVVVAENGKASVVKEIMDTLWKFRALGVKDIQLPEEEFGKLEPGELVLLGPSAIRSVAEGASDKKEIHTQVRVGVEATPVLSVGAKGSLEAIKLRMVSALADIRLWDQRELTMITSQLEHKDWDACCVGIDVWAQWRAPSKELNWIRGDGCVKIAEMNALATSLRRIAKSLRLAMDKSREERS